MFGLLCGTCGMRFGFLRAALASLRQLKASMRPSQSARKHGAGSSWSALAVSSTPKVLKEFQAQEVTGFSCRRNKPFPQFTKRTQATDLTLHPRNLNAFLLRICAFMGSAEKTQTERERERDERRTKTK